MVLIILIFVVVAGFCFYYSFILNKESKPKNVYGKIIDKIDKNLYDYFMFDKKYVLGDNFNVSGEIDFELDGTYYLQNSSINPDDIKIYNKISNLTNATTTYKYIQNNDEDKLYKEINQKINEEEVLLKKVFLENATEYVFINGASDKYINNGNSIYFETIDGSHTTKDNIDYIHTFIVNALKNSLLEEYFEKEAITTNVDDGTKDVYQMSIRLDDKRVKKIINSIIKDIKSDERANNIICGVYKDFETYKLNDDERILEKDEVYTINVYTDKIWFSPLKYEIIHLKNNERSTYTYVGDLKGHFTYVHNEQLKYGVSVQINHKTYLFEFNDSYGKSIGKIKLDKYDNMYSLDVDLTLDKKTYLVTYSSKVKDYEKNKKYTINDLVHIKYSEDEIIKFSGDIKNNIEVNVDSTIKEEVGDVVIRSSLTEVEETNYNNIKERLTERFER
ncbi:MAG: hypothetical protein IJ463_04865 [Bacilli bacterium]|nr:hypothetical protein [Bacilli bacterium]